MLTQFGKFCRRLRMETGELLKEMADKLGVSSSYLSAVEVGKRNVPSEWYNKISHMYSLSETDRAELHRAIEQSQLTIKFDLKEMDTSDRNLVMGFARRLGEFGDEEKMKLQNIFNKHDRGGD